MTNSFQKMEINKSTGEKIKVYCNRCKNETNHTVLQSVDPHGSEQVDCGDGQTEDFEWINNYQIIQCQGCETISFRHYSWLSGSEQQTGPDEWDDGSVVKLYPNRSSKLIPIKDYLNVPHTLRRIYRETIECFNNGILTLCAAGLRAIIEGICADQNIVDGPVEIKLPDGSVDRIIRKDNKGVGPII